MEEIPSKENAVLMVACQKILTFHWLAKSHMFQKRITGSSFVKPRKRSGEHRKVRNFVLLLHSFSAIKLSTVVRYF